jgi:hypothetical protein
MGVAASSGAFATSGEAEVMVGDFRLSFGLFSRFLAFTTGFG